MPCRSVLERSNDTHAYIHARTEILATSKKFRRFHVPAECLWKPVRPFVAGHVTTRETLVEFTQNVSDVKFKEISRLHLLLKSARKN